MSKRLTPEEKELRRTIRKIDGLRKRVREARSEGRTIRADAFDFDIIGKALELLRETINSDHVFKNGDRTDG